jgi:hypothetical protein
MYDASSLKTKAAPAREGVFSNYQRHAGLTLAV